MKVAWIVLDSLSFEATPFAPNGPDTMPNLQSLTQEHGVLFKRAYSPGISSASSHGSFFTGHLPSRTGMHSVNSYFDGKLATIADAAPSNTNSLLISSNPFIFRGLDAGFDVADDIQMRKNYLLFEDAKDPMQYNYSQDEEDILSSYYEFVFSEGNYLKNFLNGASYKINQLFSSITGEVEMYQYTDHINKKIREWIQSYTNYLIVANFMHVHAPLDASDEAIKKFVNPKYTDELPIGERGHDVHEAVKSGDDQVGDLMYDLYKASIWDADRKIAPVIEELREDGAFVVVTADHGNWFRRRSELDERRIHVPLVIFPPNETQPEEINHTVNIRCLPKTTAIHNEGFKNQFPGYDLLNVNQDQVSFTEDFIEDDAKGNPVSVHSDDNTEFSHYITAIKGDARVNQEKGEFKTIRGSQNEVAKLQEKIMSHSNRDSKTQSKSISRENSEVRSRLKELGYLE